MIFYSLIKYWNHSLLPFEKPQVWKVYAVFHVYHNPFFKVMSERNFYLIYIINKGFNSINTLKH